ncbi:hypothetical protein ACEWY4_008467 [Coilia grayii]|uniref:ribonuclease H n=1 Tax=Coilia grayii TaxID=363190 RepID=A0ABD1KB49_9TELE
MSRQARLQPPATRSRTAAGGSMAHQRESDDDDMVPRSHSAPPDDRTSRLEATLSAFIQAQQARDERWERETERQDLRWRSMQHQFQQLQMLVSTEQLNQRPAGGAISRSPEPELPDDHSPRQQQHRVRSASPVSEPARPVSVTPSAYYGWSPPKMTPYSDDEDIEHYLTTFERLALANQWPRGSWAVYLVPLLTGKARAAYVAMDIHDTMDYAKVKDAILNKFEIDHDTYRHRFRSMTLMDGETARELQARLCDLYNKWMRPEQKTKAEIGDAIILEQFLRMLNPELRIWVKERNPQSSKEAADLAEAYVGARRHRGTIQLGAHDTTGRRSHAPQSVGGGGHEFRRSYSSPVNPNTSAKPKPRVVCHNCGQPGHIKPECPIVAVSDSKLCYTPDNIAHTPMHTPSTTDTLVPVTIRGRTWQALVDTGSSQTFIRRACLDPTDCINVGKVRVRCIHGDESEHQTADIFIEIEGQKYLLTYVLKMRAKLEELRSLAHDNLAQAQSQQKALYDRTARSRTFNPGQKVLLLLPSSGSSLLARWQGPFEVLAKVGPVTYELAMPDRRRPRQRFHVNLLKEWVRPDTASHLNWARVVEEEEESKEQYFPTSGGETPSPPVQHLSSQQQEDMLQIIPEGLFREKPGRMTLIQHDIRLTGPGPIRQTSYRVPARLIPALKQEVQAMLDMGVIVPSHSEWCSPVVLVPKKDGGLRFCVDFSKLNAISAFDPYPMPRVDEMVERLGKAQYLSTLDLCKGYWQVPLTPEAQELRVNRFDAKKFFVVNVSIV